MFLLRYYRNLVPGFDIPSFVSTQIDDYSLVSFLPLDISEEESIETLLMYIDNAIQYGEDLDVRVPKVCPPLIN